jgi:hypothetical protein
LSCEGASDEVERWSDSVTVLHAFVNDEKRGHRRNSERFPGRFYLADFGVNMTFEYAIFCIRDSALVQHGFEFRSMEELPVQRLHKK